MNAFQRGGDAWHARCVVHATIVAILLMVAIALLVNARMEESSSGPPPDRPPPTRVARLPAGASATVAPLSAAGKLQATAGGG